MPGHLTLDDLLTAEPDARPGLPAATLALVARLCERIERRPGCLGQDLVSAGPTRTLSGWLVVALVLGEGYRLVRVHDLWADTMPEWSAALTRGEPLRVSSLGAVGRRLERAISSALALG